MASVNPQTPVNSLGQALIHQGLCSEEVIAAALTDARQQSTTLVAMLVKKGLVAPSNLMQALSARYGLPMLDLDAVNIDSDPGKLLDSKLIQRYRAIPLSRYGKQLFLAVSDPTDFSSFDDIKFNTGLQVTPVLVEEDKLARASRPSSTAWAAISPS